MSYPSVKITESHIIKNQIKRVDKKASTLSELLKIRSTEKIQWSLSPKEKKFKTHYIKFFAIPSENSPYNVINKAAVNMILSGKTDHGEVLLQDIVSENPKFHAAYNNLGLLYEIEGDFTRARKFYLKASILDSQNEIYRRNFLLLRKKNLK